MTQENLHIVLVQTFLVWEEPERNRKMIEYKIRNHVNLTKADLCVLPEMFTSGFTMHPNHVAEEMTGDSILWMKGLAKELHMAIAGSLVIKEDGKYFNRFVFAHPEGHIDFYDKRHLFTLAGEDKIYTRGEKNNCIVFRGWKMLPQVCYDLRFPVWSRNTEDYDLSLFVANWPDKRIEAWDALLKARAIENMSFCAGVNRIGADANGHQYTGHSAVYGPLGEQLAYSETEQILVTELNKSDVTKCREKLQFLNDRDEFILK